MSDAKIYFPCDDAFRFTLFPQVCGRNGRCWFSTSVTAVFNSFYLRLLINADPAKRARFDIFQTELTSLSNGTELDNYIESLHTKNPNKFVFNLQKLDAGNVSKHTNYSWSYIKPFLKTLGIKCEQKAFIVNAKQNETDLTQDVVYQKDIQNVNSLISQYIKDMNNRTVDKPDVLLFIYANVDDYTQTFEPPSINDYTLDALSFSNFSGSGGHAIAGIHCSPERRIIYNGATINGQQNHNPYSDFDWTKQNQSDFYFTSAQLTVGSPSNPSTKLYNAHKGPRCYVYVKTSSIQSYLQLYQQVVNDLTQRFKADFVKFITDYVDNRKQTFCKLKLMSCFGSPAANLNDTKTFINTIRVTTDYNVEFTLKFDPLDQNTKQYINPIMSYLKNRTIKEHVAFDANYVHIWKNPMVINPLYTSPGGKPSILEKLYYKGHYFKVRQDGKSRYILSKSEGKIPYSVAIKHHKNHMKAKALKEKARKYAKSSTKPSTKASAKTSSKSSSKTRSRVPS